MQAQKGTKTLILCSLSLYNSLYGIMNISNVDTHSATNDNLTVTSPPPTRRHIYQKIQNPKIH